MIDTCNRLISLIRQIGVSFNNRSKILKPKRTGTVHEHFRNNYFHEFIFKKYCHQDHGLTLGQTTSCGPSPGGRSRTGSRYDPRAASSPDGTLATLVRLQSCSSLVVKSINSVKETLTCSILLLF